MMSELRVLLVEDDPHMQLGCVQALQLADVRVDAVASSEEALQRIQAGFAGVVVTDMRLPRADGLSLVQRCREIDAELPVIMITGHGDVSLAVEVMRSGAYDFIQKPFAPEVLVAVVRRALEKRALTLEVNALRQAVTSAAIAARLVGHSPQIERVRRLVAEIADSPVDVLVHGETGSGKELVARALHEQSQRREAPFVALNCGGMPDSLLDSELFGHEPGAFTGAQKRRIGKIEHAHRGTLFLDEVESMPMGMQIKLLRVLQERVIERVGSNQLVPVDVRVIAATKEDLLQRSQQNAFRADLFYRLNVVAIQVPALRDRYEDIPMLLEHFMLLAASRFKKPQRSVSEAQMQRLLRHTWPGNVRELRNVAECLVLGIAKEGFGLETSSADGPVEASRSLVEMVDAFERSLIVAELERHQGNIAHSARALRIAKTTLNDKIRKHGLLR
jgi:two-component system C4-dicarboxylate transport response regulator DctD